MKVYWKTLVQESLKDLHIGDDVVIAYKELNYKYRGRVERVSDDAVYLSFIYGNGMMEFDDISISTVKSAYGYTVTGVEYLGNLANPKESFGW